MRDTSGALCACSARAEAGNAHDAREIKAGEENCQRRKGSGSRMIHRSMYSKNSTMIQTPVVMTVTSSS
jgi:hypothetical protein